MTTPHPDREELMAWIDGETTPERRRAIDAHVAACVSCAALADELRIPSAALAGWTVATPPPALSERVRAVTRRPSAPTSPWRAARWRWPVLAALVLIGIFVPLRMQCAAASSVCRLDGLRHLFSPKAAFAPVGAKAVQDSQALGDFETVWAAQPRVSLNVQADNAKVVIVAFADWQCPACKAMHQAYAPLLEAFDRERPGAVRIVHKDFPLNPACNPMLPSNFPGHTAACEAAVAVRLAREKGRADQMVAWLFANQEGLTPATVKEELAELTGIVDFDGRYAEQIDRVRADVAEAAALGVSFTPTCYVNGIKANTADGRWLPVDFMRVAINFELTLAARR